MQPRLATSDRAQPAEGNGEAAQRFPLQVVVELAVVVAVQAGAVTTGAVARGPGDPFVAGSCDRGDQRRRRRPAQYPGTGQVPKWARSEEHTSELPSLTNLVCPLLL